MRAVPPAVSPLPGLGLRAADDDASSASSSSDSPLGTPCGTARAASTGGSSGSARSRAAYVSDSNWRTASPRIRGGGALGPDALGTGARPREGAGAAGTAAEPPDLAALQAVVKEADRPLSSFVCPYDDDMHFEPVVSVAGWTSKDLVENTDIYSRDFAELSMTIRVLSLGLDPSTPLLDRLKFCCIVSSLLDEHFVQRLGAIEKSDPHDFLSAHLSLRRHIRPRTPHEDKLDRAIRAVVRDQHLCLTAEILPALADYSIALCEWAEMDERERERARAFFRRSVAQSLTPLVVDPTHPFPSFASHNIYLCLLLQPRPSLFSAGAAGESARSGSGSGSGSGGSSGVGTPQRVFLKIPDDTRLVPVDDSGLRFLPIEALVRACIDEVCRGMNVLSCHPFRVTRNVKMTLEDSDFIENADLLETVQGEIHRRRAAPPTRLEIPVDFPPDLRSLLITELGLDDADVFEIDGPMLDLTGLMSLAFCPLPELRAVVKDPQVPPRFRGIGDSLADDPGAIFRVIKERDVMIEHPRDSFDASTLLFLAASARDPRVRSIKQVIYRAGSNSPLIQALVRAAKNGKEVTVLVELKASFDEVQNCEYAHALQRAGCNVMYGLLGLKVHSKILLVVREEEDGSMETYCNISTGNFNAKTAKLYTDISIMTCHPEMCADMHDVFNSLTGYSRTFVFRVALVAPVNMTNRLSDMVREEAANARAGRPSRIVAQVNGLSDVHIIRELYDASQAGVAIDLFVRGACRLRPGLPGLSENIRVFSWVGPVLQHRRIFYYYADGAEKYYIGSADWRTRNLNDRTEVAIPVFDERNKRRLGKLLTMLNDKRYLWQLQTDGRYYKVSALSEPLVFHVQPERVWAHQRVAKCEEVAAGDGSLEAGQHLISERAFSLGEQGLAGTPRDASGQVDVGVTVASGDALPSSGESGSAKPRSADEILVEEETGGSVRSGQRYLGSPFMSDRAPDDQISTGPALGLPAAVGGPTVFGQPSGSSCGNGQGISPQQSSARSLSASLTAGGVAGVNAGGLVRARPRVRQKNKFKVSIKGNQVQVDKVSAGAVPVKFDDPADISSLRVMMVQRSDTDDPWSVPKGSMNEGESPQDAAVRITREKGGVARSELCGTIGWVLRPKRSKTVAISTFVLKVLDLGNFVNSLHDRRRKWMTFKEAIALADGSGNSFTVDSLRRALAICEEMFAKNAAALEDELIDRAESITSAGPDQDRSSSAQNAGEGAQSPSHEGSNSGEAPAGLKVVLEEVEAEAEVAVGEGPRPAPVDDGGAETAGNEVGEKVSVDGDSSFVSGFVADD